MQRQLTVPVLDVVAAGADEVRAAWALSLVQMGELSAARQVLSLAPGDLATLGMLTDPTRRPPVPRSALSQEVRDTEPSEPVTLDHRNSRLAFGKHAGGAAVLENEGDSQRLAEVASALAMARVLRKSLKQSVWGVSQR